MKLKDLKRELDTMRSEDKIDSYFLKRISMDKYELEVHHNINGILFCVLIDFDYEFFDVEYEIKRLKELMIKNYIEYLK